MERALTFAGYEVNHVWGDGGHNGKHATEIFPDAMRWLWKDWPAPVKAGAGSPQLQEILIPGEDWKLVAEGYRFTEGPAANAKGEVFFNDIPNSKTYKIGLDGKVSLFLADSKKGQRPGVRARRPALRRRRPAPSQVLAYDAAGKPTVIADGFRGNDLVVRHDGGIYVTNPGWNGTRPEQGLVHQPQGREEGRRHRPEVLQRHHPLARPVAALRRRQPARHWVYSYQIQPDGSLAHKQKYYHLHVPDTADDSGADGMRVDRDGRLYVATRMGIQVCDQAGRVNCIIPTPNGKIANLCFGGERLRHPLRHLRRQGLQAKGEGQGRQRLPGADQARRPAAVSRGGGTYRRRALVPSPIMPALSTISRSDPLNSPASSKQCSSPRSANRPVRTPRSEPGGPSFRPILGRRTGGKAG